ncbi:mucin-6 [Vombatus ursinus]|uniref:mucin-6 n=1 Tax=Vombatus ursinus TaxID=29139 RepID=UPI000FFDBE68|nr:mucin-6 [Vombatus ursinus]
MEGPTLGFKAFPWPVQNGGVWQAWQQPALPKTWTSSAGTARSQQALNKGWCSTWGGGHFSTFDKHLYEFSGTCNYILAAVCNGASPDFDIQLRRGPDKKMARIIIEVGPSVITVENSIISTKDAGVVSLPYTSNGIQIMPFGQNVRLVAKLLEMELVVMWNNDDYLMVMVEAKYMKKTCGLCGNFDGEESNEFQSKGGKFLEPYEYVALQKLDDPTEICTYEELPMANRMPRNHTQLCLQLLSQVGPNCNVSKEAFAIRCQLDLEACQEPAQPNCSCPTLSEYSRQCSMSGQPVTEWRRPNFCPLGECPGNQVYKECGMPCIKTCSNPAYSCPSLCTFGCFCPEGMVLDDISKNQSCVPIERCPCTFNRAIYAPGEVMKASCRTCQCTSGQWVCTELPCPGRCSLEGGSFITTFDSRPYRFHGTCTYILVKSTSLPNNGTLMAVYDKSGYSHSETSLTAVIYSTAKDKIMISQDELLTDDGDIKWLPYQRGNITIFRQTSTHLQMSTTFGLELVVQLRPVFQVYVKVGLQFKGNTRGLCGNYNGDTTDDFLSSMNIIEGTASLFVDSWRSGNCPSALERETDPCSMSQLNKMCAETHCSMLVKKGTVFEACHAVVNPTPFYKRCVYQACNYEETFAYICSALGSYARLCASMGLILTDWRSTVDNCTISCTGNQTFSYDSQACDRTCLSLADRTLECHPSDIPVDGCNCPEGTYLDHRSECVRQSQCPCFLEDRKFILADQSTIISGIPCYCINGRLSCTGKPPDLSESCKAPKKYLSCSQASDSKYGAACAPTCQMLATGIDCVPTKCESGCVCAGGLYENLDGDCVPADDCPCEFGGLSYHRGAQIQTECKTCTCMRGKWQCLKKDKCFSTCALYGEGHLTTFDGQRFVFDGSCEYVLTTDGCSANNSHPTFKIVTENVICGKSGITCSRAIKLFLGDLSLVLSDATYTIRGKNPQVHVQVKKNALHLLLDVAIPGKFDLTLLWNKRMSVFIKVFRNSQDALCGLCGNYNGNMKDDFEARSKYVASSELEFVNSWKENPLCGDISFVVDPCLQNPYRKAWAEKKCAIINSDKFSACHSKVYRLPYYDACVRDTCGCDSGGDCECMCDAVAAYAKACLDVGVCVDWRAPDFCPPYCDFFNTHKLIDGDGSYQYTGEVNCTWHYQPCLCPFQLQSNKYINVEGCYNCTVDQYFDHEEGRCVPCSQPLALVQLSRQGSWHPRGGGELSLTNERGAGAGPAPGEGRESLLPTKQTGLDLWAQGSPKRLSSRSPGSSRIWPCPLSCRQGLHQDPLGLLERLTTDRGLAHEDIGPGSPQSPSPSVAEAGRQSEAPNMGGFSSTPKSISCSTLLPCPDFSQGLRKLSRMPPPGPASLLRHPRALCQHPCRVLTPPPPLCPHFPTFPLTWAEALERLGKSGPNVVPPKGGPGQPTAGIEGENSGLGLLSCDPPIFCLCFSSNTSPDSINSHNRPRRQEEDFSALKDPSGAQSTRGTETTTVFTTKPLSSPLQTLGTSSALTKPTGTVSSSSRPTLASPVTFPTSQSGSQSSGKTTSEVPTGTQPGLTGAFEACQFHCPEQRGERKEPAASQQPLRSGPWLWAPEKGRLPLRTPASRQSCSEDPVIAQGPDFRSAALCLALVEGSYVGPWAEHQTWDLKNPRNVTTPWGTITTTITVAVTSSVPPETPATFPLASTTTSSPVTQATSESPGSLQTTVTQSTAQSTGSTTATSGPLLWPTLTTATLAETSRGPVSPPPSDSYEGGELLSAEPYVQRLGKQTQNNHERPLYQDSSRIARDQHPYPDRVTNTQTSIRADNPCNANLISCNYHHALCHDTERSHCHRTQYSFTNTDTLQVSLYNDNFIAHKPGSQHNSGLIYHSNHFFSHNTQTNNHCTHFKRGHDHCHLLYYNRFPTWHPPFNVHCSSHYHISSHLQHF